MAGFSDFLENKLLDHAFRNVSYTPPATVYVALFTAAPSDAGGGTEVTGGAYARRAITFGAAAAGATSNSALITFPTPTANWGTVTHVALYDALTVGNQLAWGALTNSRVIITGDTVQINIGDLDLTLD
ncbi:phage tail fiber protein [Nitrospira sp. Nam74]